MNTTLNKFLMALAAVALITACSPKASTEDTSAQTKAIVDQAVAETKKQMLADQAAEKAKQEAQVAEEAAAKAKQDAAVAQAIADTKKEMAAKQQAAAKAQAHKSSAHTTPAAAPISATSGSSTATPAAAPVAPVETPKKAVCTTCGTVVAIHEVETAGKGSGLGVVAGGVVGGLLGNQVGNGSGRDIATIAGAIGGAVAGNKIEQNSKKVKSYNVTVKMETGEEVVYHQASAPVFAKGDAVRIENNTVIKK